MQKSWRLVVLVIALLLIIQISLYSQVVSERKEIAVFKLSYYRWDIPNAVLGGIDEEIRSVFINLGRFDVVGLTQRLEEGDLNEFIEKIKAYKEEKVEIPEEVQMGKEFFTKADFDSLVGSFIVVVPTVANYVVAAQDSGEYEVEIKTSFTFVNVEEGRTFAQTFVDTEGKDESLDRAIKDALDMIPMKLTFEIRKIPEFQIKTGILEVQGSEVILELGRDLGIKVGDEYLIVSSQILQSGKTLTRENGLLVIKEVSDEVSIGKIIYSRPKPQIGDQLQELPRMGLDTTPYLHYAIGVFQKRSSTIMIGARQSFSRGFYNFRPLVGIEVPLIVNIAAAIPLNLYVGGEYDLYFGRFQLVPMAALGIGGAYLWYLDYVDVPEDKRFIFTHIGGNLGFTANYLFHKNFRFSLEAGYLLWFSFIPQAEFFGDLVFRGYDGLYVGAGLTIKY
jgi:hypothetical protein